MVLFELFQSLGTVQVDPLVRKICAALASDGAPAPIKNASAAADSRSGARERKARGDTALNMVNSLTNQSSRRCEI
nr:hypothetical protein [Bradyrhizobium sp. SZCCHNRI1009]